MVMLHPVFLVFSLLTIAFILLFLWGLMNKKRKLWVSSLILLLFCAFVAIVLTVFSFKSEFLG